MKSLGFSPMAAIAIVIAVSIGLLLFSSNDTAQADHAGIDPHSTSFNVTTDWFLCNRLPATFAGTPGATAGLQGNPACTAKSAAPSSNPDFNYEYDIASGDTNFAFLAVHLDGDFTVAADGAIADGTAMGGLRSTATLGLTNSTCSNTVFPEFIFYDSVTDVTDLSPAEGNGDASVEGTTNRFLPMVNDANTDGIADADSPAIVDFYPRFLRNFSDPDRHNSGNNPGGAPDGYGNTISPHARYTGLTQVPPGGDWIHLTILVFSPGQLAAYATTAGQETNPLTHIANNAGLGYTYLTILQDGSAETASVLSITDFCAPLDVVATFLGDPAGAGVAVTAPATDGVTQLGQLQAISLRDWDGDTFENSLDTCPFHANVQNPRLTKGVDLFLGNPVGDMIDPACDPDPNDAENNQDFDLDVFQNAQDNCGQISNVTQGESEGGANTYFAAAPDGGSKGDAIGDACDGVSSGGAPSFNPSGLGNDDLGEGAFFWNWNVGGYCITSDAATDDGDDDGWCDDLDLNDGDSGVTGEVQQNADTDTYSNQKESGTGLASPLIGIGTDPNTKCGGGNDHDGNPSDMNGDGAVAINDITGPFAPHFGAVAVDTTPTDGIPDNLGTDAGDYNNRMDLNQDGAIAINDITGPFAPDFGDVECV